MGLHFEDWRQRRGAPGQGGIHAEQVGLACAGSGRVRAASGPSTIRSGGNRPSGDAWNKFCLSSSRLFFCHFRVLSRQRIRRETTRCRESITRVSRSAIKGGGIDALPNPRGRLPSKNAGNRLDHSRLRISSQRNDGRGDSLDKGSFGRRRGHVAAGCPRTVPASW